MLRGMLQFSLDDLLKDLFLTSIEPKKRLLKLLSLRNIIDIIMNEKHIFNDKNRWIHNYDTKKIFRKNEKRAR